MERRGARDEQPQSGRLCEQLGEHRRGWKEVLEAVEDEQRRELAEVEPKRTRSVAREREHVEYLRDRRYDQRGVRYRTEGDDTNAVGKIVRQSTRELERHPCLADPTGPRQGQQPDVGPPQERERALELAFAAEERRRRRDESARRGATVD